MKKSVEQYGKTVEEAIRKSLEELKVSRDEVLIEVIDEPTTGMLGMLSSKMAKVRVTIEKKVDSKTIENTEKKAKNLIENIFKITKETSTFNVINTQDKIEIKIDSGQAAHLIGYKGKTIEALQVIINSILQKEENTIKVFVEVNDYKIKKEEKLKYLAKKMEKNAIKYKKNIRLEPMSAYERMIIHTELAGSKQITTESIGDEPKRRVVIKYKG